MSIVNKTDTTNVTPYETYIANGNWLYGYYHTTTPSDVFSSYTVEPYVFNFTVTDGIANMTIDFYPSGGSITLTLKDEFKSALDKTFPITYSKDGARGTCVGTISGNTISFTLNSTCDAPFQITYVIGG